jgi:hypothetical protein
MPKPVPKDLEDAVKALAKLNYSYSMIIKELKDAGKSISKNGITKILNSVGKNRSAKSQGLPTPPKVRPPTVVNCDVIRKIKKMIDLDNPPTQKVMANKVGISQTTVHRVIKKLNKRIVRKARCHILTEKHKKIRRRTCKLFHQNYLTEDKSEFVVTLDEAMFSLQDTNGRRSIYYELKTEKNPRRLVVNRRENFCKKFMVVGGLSGRGVLPLIRVPPKVKVSAQWYIDFVLIPYLEVEVPKLYGRDTSKVIVHHDAASSHTAKLTQAYARDLKDRTGITIIMNDEIMVKSPDAAPLDFFGFGYLKRRAFTRRATTSAGLWKILKEEWNNIDRGMIERVYSSWKKRCQMIVIERGSHIENIKTLHHQKFWRY